MGYWHETCIITNLPILGEGKAIALKTNSSHDIEFVLDSWWFNGISFAKGELDPYGELHNIESTLIDNRLKNKKFSTEKPGFIVFCYADVWEKIIKYARENIDDLEESVSWKNSSELELDLCYFCAMMYRARSGFPKNLQRGSQDLDVSYRKFIAEITLEKIKEIEKILESEK
jgi:hypothetical protein